MGEHHRGQQTESGGESSGNKERHGLEHTDSEKAVDVVVLGGFGGASTATVSRPAIATPARAAGTNNTKNRESAGACDHDRCSTPIPAAANAPIEPAAVATAL
jgi:hypothetical protein